MNLYRLIEETRDFVCKKLNTTIDIYKVPAAESVDDRGSINKDIASMIDHTLLKPEAVPEQIIRLCREAVEYRFASVCVNPCYTELASKTLAGSGIKTCCVIGFPLGAATSDVKADETRDAISNGADEVDMVINIGALKSGDLRFVKDDIGAVVSAAGGKALVKVIIETCFLSDKEKIAACIISKLAGADFVKTSTGFGTSGAKEEDVMLMRRTVGFDMGVKASGGIRDYETAAAMIKAGANRLGTSSGIIIINGAES